MKLIHTVAFGLMILGSIVPVQAAPPAAPPKVIQAQGHSHHIDFVAQSRRRSDLRMSIQSKGLDAAFTEWLRVTHPHVYNRHIGKTG